MGRTINALGGRGRANQIEKWQATNWTIQLYQEEIVPKSNKRKAENTLVQSQVKKIALLKENLESCQQSLKDANKKLKEAEETNERLSLNKVSKHNKSWSEYSAQHKRKHKKQIASDIHTALKFTENTHFIPSRIELKNKETNEQLTISQDGSIATTKQLSSPCETQTIAKQTLYVKERFNISNTAYHELSMIHPLLPSWSALNTISKEMDARSTIRPTPGPIIGIQQSLKQRLTVRLENLVKKFPNIKDEPYVAVKITGDGTNVSRSMHILVIAFTILDGIENPNSPIGNHVIAMLNCQENYEHLSVAMKDIVEEMKLIKSISIDGHEYNIKFYLGADMKYLAICLGIQAANSTYSCIWCKCPADERHDTSKSWCSVDEGARTIDEIQKLSLKKKKELKYGCIHEPIFPSIPVDRVIPDILHLFLRISDILINMLILELRRMDGIEKLRTKEFKQSTVKHLNTYITYLNVNCKISFHMYVDKESNVLKWRDLTGPEKCKLFASIKIPELFPDLKNADIVQKLWDNFKVIYKILWSNKKLDENGITDFTTKVTSWITLFTSVYHTRHVTPYMHVLVAHVPKFLKDIGSLAPYSQQGLEKLNDDITKDYFKSTNHRNKGALSQIMLKLNRLEELTDRQYYRTKHLHVCSNCKEMGHNCKTCPTPKP